MLGKAELSVVSCLLLKDSFTFLFPLVTSLGEAIHKRHASKRLECVEEVWQFLQFTYIDCIISALVVFVKNPSLVIIFTVKVPEFVWFGHENVQLSANQRSAFLRRKAVIGLELYIYMPKSYMFRDFGGIFPFMSPRAFNVTLGLAGYLNT